MARKAILRLKNTYHEEKVAHIITYSPNSRILATCCDKNSIILWDVATGHAIHQLIHDAPLYTMAFSPDSKVIASVGSNKNIILWNVETGTLLHKTVIGYTDQVDQVVFSPDGHTLASRGHDGRIILWDVRTQESIEQLPITLSQFEAYSDMDFSMDGAILAVISGKLGNEITLWNVKNHESVAHQLLSYYPIFGVAFGPADQLMTIVNIGHGGIVHVLWETKVDSWIAHACSIVNRNLTTTEWNQFVTGEPYSKVCPGLSS
jgi:WD40 repeat protein